jgi:pilus assembly protein CpaD
MTSNMTASPAGERRNIMPQHINARGSRKLISAAMLAVSAALLASCGNSQLTTGSIPDDYRTRHPIVLAEGERTMDIPVASGDVRLPNALKDNVRGFAQGFMSSPAGVIQIQVPHGSYNSGAASHLAGDVRRTLTEVGIRQQRILMSSYAASANGDAAPIRLSYVTTRAMAGPCGNWPEDLSNNTFGNRNWSNFGCASQNNLAAQIANPTDLIAPRGMTPIDATQRATVISTYRGETKTTD